jgi:gamma-glutamylcyclotransferase (GGCT)/AIG2-like uncharacterized protein YtfP
MKKLIAISLLSVILTSFKADNDTFVGKILYKNSYTDLDGNDITEKVAPYFGRQQHYFIDNRNYKAYDESNNWSQLYNSETNQYFYFKKDKTAMKFDGSIQTSQKFIVTKLDKKELVAGYECEAIQVETDHSTTVYYYNSTIKTNSKAFSKHNFGEWNQYLEATGGALSLKFVTTNNKGGYISTSTATEVSRQNLTAKDFVFPSDYSCKN